MGAKQSKRSVDISGKEAEGAGEVAAAGAGGEGRVEALADADALKPQANGGAHIHDQTDKEKQLDSGTPENEKDATTEKEAKEEKEGEGDKVEVAEAATPAATNGDTGDKPENGDSSPAPAPEDGKKPKKEKVKKKWSLRSISFSRKDKPKQEKKQKEEEPKTNGEPEKVPEEAAEATPESATTEVAAETKPEPAKEDKTPETPVTEPLTNGSSTPESPKVESPAAEEPAPVVAPAPATATAAPEPKAEPQPEQLPVNGLSLEEPKLDVPEAQSEESKPEKPATDATETAPAPEIPVKKEVCVEQMPLETTPPPLPANPPPSSVASFAATTMAPELTDASLANTAELAISAPTSETLAPEPLTDTTDNNVTAATELPPPLKEPDQEKPAEPESVKVEPELDNVNETPQLQVMPVVHEETIESVEPEVQKVGDGELESKAEQIEPPIEKLELQTKTQIPEDNATPEIEKLNTNLEKIEPEIIKVNTDSESGDSKVDKTESLKTSITAGGDVSCLESNVDTYETVPNEITLEVAPIEELPAPKDESPEGELPPAPAGADLLAELSEPAADCSDTSEDLPPPPPEPHQLEETTTQHDTKANLNHISENIEINHLNTEQLNGNIDTQKQNLKNKNKDSLGNVVQTVECNGNGEEGSQPVSAEGEGEQRGAPATGDPSQEPIPMSDKLADLIPEVPVVPELNTQTETASDVAVAN